ncbi:hypothetical protein VB002_15430 [Campylobacter concisus]
MKFACFQNQAKRSFYFCQNLAALKKFTELIRADEGGERLLENFSKERALPSGKFSSNASFFSLFCIAGRLLGLSDEFKKAGRICSLWQAILAVKRALG